MCVGQSPTIGYQLIGDNVDFRQKPSRQSMENRGQDHHLFHLYAAKHRVLGEHLPNDKPIRDVATLPLSTFLPSVSECETYQNELQILVGRVIVKHISYFSCLSDLVPEHIKHRYSWAMKQKSEIVRDNRYALANYYM